jgi:hypothetical protein
LAVHGVGVLRLGCKDYNGRSFTDQYNYASLSQFLVDVPFSTDWDAIGHRPYLADGLKLKDIDRLGAMLLQGFFAVTTGRDTKTVFEPLMLLGPALTVPLLVCLGRRLGLGRWSSLLAAMAAGLMPAVCLLRLNCFLSQVVSIPLLLLAVLALHDCARRAGVATVLRAALALAAVAAVFVELTPVLLLLCAGFLLGGVVLGVTPFRRALTLLVALPLLALLLNPWLCGILVELPTRVQVNTSGGHPFQHLYRLRGVAGFWIHEHRALEDTRRGHAAVALAAVLSAAAFVGLARLVISRHLDGAARERRLLGLAVAGLVLLPAVLWKLKPECPYQVCKMLGSVAPLFAALVALAFVRLGRLGAGSSFAVLGLTFACGAAGTASMSWQATRAEPQPRSWQHLTAHADYRDVQRTLKRCRGQDVVLAAGPGVYHNCWLAYAARRNRVWLVNPCINDGHFLGDGPPPRPGLREMREGPRGHSLIDLDHLPTEVLVVTSRYYGEPQVKLAGDCRLVGGNATFSIWKMGPGPYTIEPLPGAWRWPEAAAR